MDMEKINMNIAVLSGKGGTGKTLVSVNLASVANEATYIDCDVEEPNGHLFLKPIDIIDSNVAVKVPYVNNNLCDGCRKCVEFCKFNALAHTKDKLIVFEQICHSCGGCIMFCPQNALLEKDKDIGKISKGISNDITTLTGELKIGESSGVPIIKELLKKDNLNSNKFNIIDCPPGSACVVMESIKDADFCILVAEPTLFGLHNLSMVYELVNLFNKPLGIVINKCIEEKNPIEKFCLEKNLNILAKIPFDKEIGRINSNGDIIVKENRKYYNLFSSLLKNIKEEVDYETIINSKW